jgi:hypothetical protein
MPLCAKFFASLTLALAAGGPAGTAAQSVDSAPAVALGRATDPIRVDGVLDEPAWAEASVIPLAYETAPGDNTPARAATDCRLLFDEDRLYLGCRASDPRPGEIRAFITDRDRTEGHDRILLMLDPFADARRGFEFAISPLGVQADAMFDQVSDSLDLTWDAIWSSAGRITADGYVVEAAVPFKSLRFPGDRRAQAWGFFLRRSWPRSVGIEMRSARLERGTNCALCQAQRLTGLSGLSPGLNLELVPTITSRRTDRRDEIASPALDAGPLRSEAGLDLRWGPIPGVTLNAAVNPDFSQVEADAAQLDVNNRFALFFPERRPFFLEAADLFATPIQAVFTRTVADPLWGAKLTGKSGGAAAGVIVARDGVNQLLLPGAESSSAAATGSGVTLGIGRLRQDVGRSSTVGALVTARRGAGYHNLVGGADAVLRPSPSLEVEGQYLRSDSRYPDAFAAGNGQSPGPLVGAAWHLGADYTTAAWNLGGGATHLSPDFRTDAGFTPQVGTRKGYLVARRFIWGKPGAWFTKLQADVWYDWTDDWRGRLVYDSRGLFWRYDGPLRLILAAEPAWERQRAGSASFPIQFTKTFVGLSPSGSLSVGLGYWFGEGLDLANATKGRRVTWRPTTTIRLGRHLEATALHVYDRLALPAGLSYRANLTDLRATYSFTSRAFLRLLLQYRHTARDPAAHRAPTDRVSKVGLGQLLFSYKVNPQTVLFVGYVDNRRGTVDSTRTEWPLTQTDRTLFAKIGYAWRP